MSGDGRIRVLPDPLVDMIAAGEVVERPASIVKELVENALDAGATRVEVSVRRGGIEEIVVTDDGGGMAPEDLRLALLRHATSKLRELADLEAIRTFGFRGEALPSIASVSRLTLVSRTRGMEAGHGLAGEGTAAPGELVEAMAPGTRIVVRDLFHNVPARLKFLKTEATEAAHVQDVIVDVALSEPGVHFRLVQDGRLQLDLAPQPDRLRRAQDVLARRARTGLYPWEATGPEGARLALVMSAPEVHLAEASGVYLFVNRRPVRDRLLLSAVTGAYGGLLPKGRYPVVVLHLDLPPAMVDVNVHPQKTQVRFRSERLVAGFVRSSLQAALAAAPWVAGKNPRSYQLRPETTRAAEAGSETDPESPASEGKSSSAGTSVSSSLPVQAAMAQALARVRQGAPRTAPVRSSARPSPAPARPESAPVSPAPVRPESSPVQSESAPVRPESAFARPESAFVRPESAFARKPGASAPGARAPGNRGRLESLFSSSSPAVSGDAVPGDPSAVPAAVPAPESDADVRYLGCHDGLYLLFSRAGLLIVMDMHAASERVRYNEILANLRGARALCQGLLLPLTVEVERAPAWEPHLDDLRALGFDLDLFGDRQLVIRGVPASLGTRPVEPLLSELYEDLVAGRETAEGLVVHERMAATMACHSALRKHDPITPEMALRLFEQIRTIPAGGHCPHGRPVSMELSTTELEAGFLRR